MRLFRLKDGKEANALLIAMIPVLVIMGLVTSYMSVSQANSRNTSQQMSRLKALYASEAGVSSAIHDLNSEYNSLPTQGDPVGAVAGTLSNHCTYSVHIVDWGSDSIDNDNDGRTDESDELEYRTVVSTGVSGYHDRRIEVVVAGPAPHPSLFYAIYAGNRSDVSGYELAFGGQTGQASQKCDICNGKGTTDRYEWEWQLVGSKWKLVRVKYTDTCWKCGGTGTITYAGTENHADEINGDVYASGDIKFTGNSNATGDIRATGRVTGNPPEGEVLEGTDPLFPPNIPRMNYEDIADYKVDTSLSWGDWAEGGQILSSSDPRHIFVKEHEGDLPTVTDNTDYFLRDPYTTLGTDTEEEGSPTYGGSMNLVTIDSSANNKVYFVDGNLWLDSSTVDSFKLMSASGNGTQITIVAKGNIYISDSLYFENAQKDGIALIAISDGESYVDENMNLQYDAGEQIIDDDGDGVYEGVREGSGNLVLGDPRDYNLGTVNGYLHAENDFLDLVLDEDGKPLEFQVNGGITVGGVGWLSRDYGGQHAKMIVTFDERLRNKDVRLPRLPQWGDFDEEKWRIVSWREVSHVRAYAGLD